MELVDVRRRTAAISLVDGADIREIRICNKITPMKNPAQTTTIVAAPKANWMIDLSQQTRRVEAVIIKNFQSTPANIDFLK